MALHEVQLTKLTCHGSSEDHDEVYLVSQVDGGYPIRFPFDLSIDAGGYERMNDGDEWDLNLTYPLDREILITVWDKDGEDDMPLPWINTFLANYQLLPTYTLNQKYSYKFQNRNGADYHLHFKFTK